MNIIQFREANCKSCYKCIRTCDLKAITFTNEQAQIIEDNCVLCGKCTLVCPQNAKQLASDLPLVQNYLLSEEQVYVSLDPAYVAAFPGASFSAVSAALKRLGFTAVEESAIGATEVSREYTRLLEEGSMKNLITSSCHTSVLLIEKYYPSLIPYLAPVASPATAHARMMRRAYGGHIKVVYVGPCISKKHEAHLGGDISAVLLFDELKDWLRREGVQVGPEDPNPAEMHDTAARTYPVPDGILSTLPLDVRQRYKTISIDGLTRAIYILDLLRDNQFEGYLIEMNACEFSCVGGPGLHTHKPAPYLISKDQIMTNMKKPTLSPPPASEHVACDLSADFIPRRVSESMPSEEAIRDVLIQLGKNTPGAILNCGTCGYATCREKAIAVCQGKAELRMCLPFMREKAESMSNTILENTPNAVFMLDQTCKILQYNQAAAKLLRLSESAVGQSIETLLDVDSFREYRRTGQSALDRLCQTVSGDLTVRQSIIPISNGDILVILKDVTQEQQTHREMELLRRETIETTQQVIDKQMRVAQEIASLLGETTGETKAALIKLKKSIMQGDSL